MTTMMMMRSETLSCCDYWANWWTWNHFR